MRIRVFSYRSTGAGNLQSPLSRAPSQCSNPSWRHDASLVQTREGALSRMQHTIMIMLEGNPSPFMRIRVVLMQRSSRTEPNSKPDFRRSPASSSSMMMQSHSCPYKQMGRNILDGMLYRTSKRAYTGISGALFTPASHFLLTAGGCSPPWLLAMGCTSGICKRTGTETEQYSHSMFPCRRRRTMRELWIPHHPPRCWGGIMVMVPISLCT